MKKLMTICLVVVLGVSGVATAADWTPFIIRNANTTGEAPTYSLDSGVLTVDVDSATGGQKVGYGTSYLEGQRLDSVFRFQVIRLDEHENVYAPYINIWVTDGSNYAVLSLEPSHYPEFDWTHDLYAADYLSIEPWIYETDRLNVDWILPGAYCVNQYLYGSNDEPLTIADIGHLTIKAPTPEELATGWVGLGSGAPRELGTNIAYGFNLVFGDTQSNYVGGYQIDADPTLIGGIPDALWVDDDYCATCNNDGHIWGYDAFDNIPEALDAADDGYTIIVKPGEYAGALVTKSVEIRGEGGAVISSGPLPYEGHPNPIIAAFMAGFFFAGEGAGSGATISHLTFEDVEFPVMSRGADNVTVDHCTMNNPIQGVSDWGGSGWNITHNVILDLRTYNGGGIGILSGARYGGNITGNVLSHNQITGILHVDPADGGGYCGTGVVLYADFRWGWPGADSIANNQITKNKISLVSDTPEVVDVVAVELTEAEDPDPETNVIYDNMIGFNDLRGTDWAISLTPASLEEVNTITRNLGTGIGPGTGLRPSVFGPFESEGE
jgi:hypothetical protein